MLLGLGLAADSGRIRQYLRYLGKYLGIPPTSFGPTYDSTYEQCQKRFWSLNDRTPCDQFSSLIVLTTESEVMSIPFNELAIGLGNFQIHELL